MTNKPLTAAEFWAVWRQDTHGNVFKMEGGLSREKAKSIAEEFEAKLHKQHYWIKPDN